VSRIVRKLIPVVKILRLRHFVLIALLN
jgi:hypothetical protein